MDDEEEIPVKYKLDGETEWQVKKEAVMKLGKTEWAIRLKLCKQGENHSYYSLHVAALTPNQVSRLQIKCTHQVEPPVVDWEQEYTFGGAHTVLVNPCLLKIAEQKEKMTFVVELKLLNDSEKKPEKPFECEKEINFPGGDFILKSGNRKLKINSAYVKRRCPLLGYLFENEETKEYDVGDVEFEDLVDIFGIFQNRWELEADRMIHLIPIARKFGFDIWGKSLNREFSQLMHRLDPVEIVAEPNEEPVKFEFNTTLKWAIDDFELIGPSTLPKNQNLMVTWEEQNRNCIIYTYTQEILGEKYVSLGFQMSRPSTSATTSDDDDDEEDVNVIDDESVYSEDQRVKYFDIDIHVINENGRRLHSDRIQRIRDDEYTIVGTPIFAYFDHLCQYLDEDGALLMEINWIENHDMVSDDEEDDDLDFSKLQKPRLKMPGLTNCFLRCEGQLIEVNREFLAHSSQYFSGLFSKNFREGYERTVNLTYEHLPTLKLGLQVLYNRRLPLNDVEISRVLDFADRICAKSVMESLQRQLWSCKNMSFGDKKWLAEEFMLTDLKIKCTMEQNEEMLRVTRVTRKRPRPVDFEDDVIEPPPQPRVPVISRRRLTRSSGSPRTNVL
ncbi:BTB domain-containing protein [Caenorhabditis elegans]|uniref:BTB domain-containing protein n=1 Tax=Caenorhabditis elegans TaxID=6239 RepID=Q9XWN3_CAEEL|nr:BTB domain-containing protein [Caenorhabditis elegans]CAA21618.2 BTB domain-containing protein [Caenorhabditis elegans]|eukprot:NP_507803.2 Uncharacterized protein CELE_Y43F8C.3 [Caenorhabditis elegans]